MRLKLLHSYKRKVPFYSYLILFTILQNPREADPMTKVQAELDETKVVLVSVVCAINSDLYMYFTLFYLLYLARPSKSHFVFLKSLISVSGID